MAVSDENIGQLETYERPVNINDIQYDTVQRTILIRDKTVRLTPTQYRLFTPLRHGAPVTYADLAHATYNCAIDENVRKTIDKQIDRIRTKLHGTGLYIYCVIKYGYILLEEVVSEKEK